MPYTPRLPEYIPTVIAENLLSYWLLYNVFLDASDAVLITDGNLILAVNKATPFLFGYDVSELLGQSVDMLVPEGKRVDHSHLRDEFIRQPRFRDMGALLDVSGQAKDGTTFPITVSLAPLMEVAGLRVVVTVRRRVSLAS